MAEIHVWVGDEDPFILPIGGLTLVIHQGTASNTNPPPDESGGTGEGDGGVPSAGGQSPTSPGKVTLKDPTPGKGTYINLVREPEGAEISERLRWVLDGGAGQEVGIQLPDLVSGVKGGREQVVEPIFDELRTTSHGNLKVHLIRASDLPSLNE